MKFFCHPTAEIATESLIGEGTKIWQHAHIREKVTIGKQCVIGKGVYIDYGVKIGDYCKIQNYCSIYTIAVIENGVFIGPHSVLINDKNPRAINKAGKIKKNDDWTRGKILIKYGASIGAHVVVMPDTIIGSFALIGAGSLVTKNIPDFSLAYGNPIRIYGKVNEEGFIVKRFHSKGNEK